MPGIPRPPCPCDATHWSVTAKDATQCGRFGGCLEFIVVARRIEVEDRANLSGDTHGVFGFNVAIAGDEGQADRHHLSPFRCGDV